MTTPENNTLPNAQTCHRVVSRRYSPEEIALRARAIYETTLRQSPRVTTGNFTAIAADDLALLFRLYDERFFGGDLGRLILASSAPLNFSLSARLTRSAGLTKRYGARGRPGVPLPPATRYEISLSTALLFQTFQDVERTVRVNGLVCADRLEAAQRVFEHELIHLVEMLVWGTSSCQAGRFRDLVWNLFGHTQTRHDLVTQQERARTRFDVRVGDRVSFFFEGVRRIGVVSRITRRATVLVEDPSGQPYTDGKRYLKFYIPIPLLEKAS